MVGGCCSTASTTESTLVSRPGTHGSSSGIAPTLVAPIPEQMAESFASGHEDMTLKFRDTNGQVSEVQPLLAHMLTGPMHGFPSMTPSGLAALGFFFE